MDAGGGSVTYTPNQGAAAPDTDSFAYTVEDGAGGSATANVAITIGAASGPPTATHDTATTDEDTPVTIDLLANDHDPDGDALRVTALTDPTVGTLVDHGDGTVTYTPNANANGADTFSYTITDDHFGFDTATVSITVNAVNDIPTASSGTVTISAGTATSFQLLGSDVETCDLAFSIVAPPAVGSVSGPTAVACTAGSAEQGQGRGRLHARGRLDRHGYVHLPDRRWDGVVTGRDRRGQGDRAGERGPCRRPR